MKLGQKLAVNYIRARLNLLAVISKKKAAAKAFEIFCTPFYRSKKEAPAIFKKAAALSINIKGITVRGYKWNQGGTKRVLILHGFESSVSNFDAYVSALVNKNYEVLAFDAPGHGISSGKQITLPLYIYMIETIYYSFGGIQGFIAHSFGGLAVTHLIEKLPPGQDIRLVLIAPATEADTAIDSFFRFLQLGENVKREFKDIIQEKSGVASSWFSVPRALRHIQSPVLWVHDEYDDITPLADVQPVMRSAQPNISLFITRGLGHKKIYRDNGVVQKVVDFL
jgi:pimeloyl-ACP methyl ester carboxylesterase